MVNVLASEVAGTLDVTGALSGLTTCASSILTWITGNAVLSIVFVGGCIAGVAFKFIRKAVKTSKA